VDLGDLLPGSYGEGFTEALWTAVQFEDRPHGIPWHADVSALVYNREVFEWAGITSVADRLEDAWTWEEFLDVARRIRDRGGERVSAFGMNWQEAGAFRWLNWLYAAGGRMINDDATQATLEGSAECRKTLEYFQTWFAERVTPANLTPRGAYPSEVFPTERLGMISAGDFLLPTFDESVTRFEYGATFLPRDQAAATGGTAIAVTRDSERPEVAASFARFMGEEAN
jgi:multiple sugar transport system substrate-binding protein